MGAWKQRLRLCALVLVPLAALGAGVAGTFAARGALNLPGPLLDPVIAPAAPAAVVAEPSQRVLLVVLDGLRADVARNLPTVSRLAASGAWADLVADGPTYSAPQYLALLTGLTPRVSGLRTNAGVRRFQLDSVPAQLRARGLRTVVVGDEVDWWGRLAGEGFSSSEVVHPEDLVATVAHSREGAAFVLAHLCEVDQMGHQYGGASPEYLAAAKVADERLGQLLEGWSGTVAVLADHGHSDGGGHGGDEDAVRGTWLVLAGPGVRVGGQAGGRAVDVAPTLAALLGIPAPAQAEGQTLVDLLEVGSEARAGLVREDAARAERVALAVGRAEATLRGAELWGGVARLAGVLVLGLLWFLLAGTHRRLFARGALAGVIALAGAAAGWPVVRGPLSFSSGGDQGDLILSAAALAGGALCVAMLVARFAWRGLVADRTGALALFSGGLAGNGVLAVVTLVVAGASGPRVVCEPAWLAVLPTVAFPALVASALVTLALSVVAVLAPVRPR